MISIRQSKFVFYFLYCIRLISWKPTTSINMFRMDSSPQFFHLSKTEFILYLLTYWYLTLKVLDCCMFKFTIAPFFICYNNFHSSSSAVISFFLFIILYFWFMTNSSLDDSKIPLCSGKSEIISLLLRSPQSLFKFQSPNVTAESLKYFTHFSFIFPQKNYDASYTYLKVVFQYF